jgi:predicted ATP-dependent endonuclease of OLD family
MLNQYQFQFIPNLQPQEPEKIKQNFEKLKQLVPNLTDLNPDKLFEIVKKYLPNFILFKTFEDILPDSIPIFQAQTTPIISDLGTVTDFDFSKIQPSIDMAVRAKEKEKINLKFKEEYKEFWTQDNAHLYVDFDSSNIYFLFKEGEHFFKPKMRSKGKQWHFAFYVRVTARSVEEERNVILIDEPGLFLHAKAQKEILKKLEEVSSNVQIIYTTHSPYLIPSSKLYRVRLVIKKREDRGTVIEKITAKADKETLSPILTAIGEDLSVGIRVDRKNSIVVEGYSDYLWLVSWKNLLNIDKELNFIPAVGGGSTVHVGSILFGWGLDPIFMLDNDQQGKAARKKLEKKLGIESKRILLIPFNKDGEIEDFYSNEEKKKLGITSKNKENKTIVAHQFLQQVERKEIRTEDFPKAKENFKKLFEQLINIIKCNNHA